MKLSTGLFRAIRKRMGIVHDTDMGKFREKLELIVKQKDSMSDDDIAKSVEELKAMSNDLPDGDDKSKLLRFLEDFKSVKEQDANVAEEAAKSVADLFEKLDTEAMKDAPAPAASAAPETTSTETEKIKTETEAPDTKTASPMDGKAKDADPNAEYTLEEIYQFIKRREQEDAAKDAAPEKKEVEKDDFSKTETAKDGCAKDHAVTVTLANDHAATGGLDDLFAKAKGGNR